MKPSIFSDAARRRIANWTMSAVPVKDRPVWTEVRQAVDFNGHTYIINNGQVFQCAHCGNFDPEWSATEVLTFFAGIGIKPYEIEITCSVVVVTK